MCTNILCFLTYDSFVWETRLKRNSLFTVNHCVSDLPKIVNQVFKPVWLTGSPHLLTDCFFPICREMQINVIFRHFRHSGDLEYTWNTSVDHFYKTNMVQKRVTSKILLLCFSSRTINAIQAWTIWVNEGSIFIFIEIKIEHFRS